MTFRKMTYISRLCQWNAGKVCNHFMPVAKTHKLCTNCHGKSCNKDDRCDHCLECTNEKWERVTVYLEKLPAQHKRKREKKTCSKTSSSSFSGFSLITND